MISDKSAPLANPPEIGTSCSPQNCLFSGGLVVFPGEDAAGASTFVPLTITYSVYMLYAYLVSKESLWD